MELKKRREPYINESQQHSDILNQLWGIDINQFPAHLSAINLAVRNLDSSSKNMQIIVSDFFKVAPTYIKRPNETMMVLYTETTTLNGSSLATIPILWLGCVCGV